jgi:hypothetical protein
VFRAVQKSATIHDYLQQHPGVPIVDPAWLLPPNMPSLFESRPTLIHYVQLPTYLWIPEFFFPHLVPAVPCPSDKCPGFGTRQRWNSGGPRVVHDVGHAVYLHYWEYKCKVCAKTFKGIDDGVLRKLPMPVQAQFPFHLTAEEGVTLPLLHRITSARMMGSSLNALRQELMEARHWRMHRTIVSYYSDCYNHQKPSIGISSWGKGATEQYDRLAPQLHTEHGYHDHPAPSVALMQEVYLKWAAGHEETWTRDTMQRASENLSIDAQHRLPKKVTGGAFTRLWSAVDPSTGCIHHQQLLTNETNADVLPMMEEYANRCRSLGVPLPRRVCSDRGLMDEGLINHPRAFPDAHINVDNWHWQQRLAKTLNIRSPLYRIVYRMLRHAMYQDIKDEYGLPTGRQTMASPAHIISEVRSILNQFSGEGTGATGPAVTTESMSWFEKQVDDIQSRRILSNPIDNEGGPLKIASSAQENYHRQLNRVTRFQRCSAQFVHLFLQHFNFRWNASRLRDPTTNEQHDWITFDIRLVHEGHSMAKLVHGEDVANSMYYNRPWLLPPRPAVSEHFGTQHQHVTLATKLPSANLNISEAQIDTILGAFNFTIAPLAQLHDGSGSTAASVVGTNTNLTEPGLMPSARMSHHDLTMLRTLLTHDQVFRSCVDDQRWEEAVKYWNSFIGKALRSHRSKLRIAGAVRNNLHLVTDESLRNGHQVVLKADAAVAETQVVAFTSISKTPIPLSTYTIAQTPFSTYEKQMLDDMVPRYRKFGASRINWVQLQGAWKTQYMTEYIDAAKQVKLTHRDKDTLRSVYQTMHRNDKDDRYDTSTVAVIADDDTVPLVMDEMTDIPPTSSSAASAAGQLVSAVTGTGSGARWSPEGDAEVKRLFAVAGTSWSWEYFTKHWQRDVYGDVTIQQLKNKTASLKQAAKKAANPPSKKVKTK